MMRFSNAKKINQYINDLVSEDEAKSSEAELQLAAIGVEAVPSLIKATRDFDHQKRWKSVWILGKIGDKKAYSAITSCLNDVNAYVRYDAALSLGHLHDKRAIKLLVERMKQATLDKQLSDAATRALVMFGDDAIAELIPLLQHPDVLVRILTVTAMGKIRNPRVITYLASALRDEEEDVQVATIEALAEIGGSSALALIDQCVEYPSDTIRSEAIYWSKHLNQQSVFY